MSNQKTDISKTATSEPDNADMWKIVHTLVQVSYLGKKSEILKLWKKISSGKELRPSIWNRFVDSERLWKMFWWMFLSLSHVTIDDVSLCEMVEEGNLTVTNEGEEYFFVPLTYAVAGVPNEDVEKCKKVSGEFRTIQERKYSCQQFIKRIMIYAFADIYGRPFLVQYKTHPSKTFDKDSINERLCPR